MQPPSNNAATLVPRVVVLDKFYRPIQSTSCVFAIAVLELCIVQ